MMSRQKIYHKEHPETIQSLFDTIAKSYDRTNTLVSFNFHRTWNQALAQMIAAHLDIYPNKLKSYLDLCAGTGEIAFSVLKEIVQPIEVFLLDFSPEMLACAREKEAKRNSKAYPIHYIQANAEMIPLPENSLDAVSIAYGIRNVKHTTKCLQEVFRVLRPGGQFAILELTRPRNFILRAGHSLYLKFFLPVLGRYATANKEAYRYLSESIRSFSSSVAIEKMLREVGFVEVKSKALTGGIATLICGICPP